MLPSRTAGPVWRFPIHLLLVHQGFGTTTTEIPIWVLSTYVRPQYGPVSDMDDMNSG